MKKVIKIGENVFEPCLEYCEQKELEFFKKENLCPFFGGEVEWKIPNRIEADNITEAGEKLDESLKEMVQESINCIKMRYNCAECDNFDVCHKMKLISLLENISHKLNYK